MASRNRLYSVILTSLFFVAIFIPLLVVFFQDEQDVSEIEKRSLAARPSFPRTIPSLLTYPDRLERYFDDHFGLRQVFLDLYAKGKIMLGDTAGAQTKDGVAAGKVIKGKNGWYFLNRVWDGDPVADYRNLDLYSDRELARAVLAYAARQQWLADQGIEYLLFFAPNKHTVYSEYLPDYLTKQGDVSSLDQLQEALARYTSVQFIDLRPVLQRGKSKAADYWQGDQKEARLYWKTDSHWNGAGADIAQYAVARKIEEMLPGLITPRYRDKKDFRFMPGGKGDLATFMNDKNLFGEKGPVVRLGKCSDATREEFQQEQQVTTCREGKVNAVIFHDSFYFGLKPFFADYFATTVFLWEKMRQKRLQVLIARYKPAIVIEEQAERYLPYVPDIHGELYNTFWHKLFARGGDVIFTLDGARMKAGKGYTNTNFSVDSVNGKGQVAIRARNGDPYCSLPDINFHPERMYVLKVVMSAPAETVFELFFSRRGKENAFPNQGDTEQFRVKKGLNTLYIPLLSGDLGKRLRFDPGKVKGRYEIKRFAIREITLDSLQGSQ